MSSKRVPAEVPEPCVEEAGLSGGDGMCNKASSPCAAFALEMVLSWPMLLSRLVAGDEYVLENAFLPGVCLEELRRVFGCKAGLLCDLNAVPPVAAENSSVLSGGVASGLGV